MAGPDSCLLAAPPALAGCVRAFYWHDLRPLGPELTLAQRTTHVPPGPYNGIVWLVEGQATLVDCGGRAVQQALPPVFVAGAHRHPYRSLAIAPYCSFGLAFQPAALALLSGLPMGERLDTISDARSLLPADWQPWLAEVATAPDHGARIAACERFLAPRWAALVAAQPAWRTLATQAWQRATRGPLIAALNWSQRHFQRRAQTLIGMPPGEVERLLRVERALLDLRDGRAAAAEAAALNGYADQPHFSREVKAAYRSSPGALMQRLAEDGSEDDWLLKL
ncbi:MAG: helix-turn-helix domain-containing protein [Burkholderiales bacterium]|nr:helix-turn-helix domain-containing protein [Burkholderiales bacterium]